MPPNPTVSRFGYGSTSPRREDAPHPLTMKITRILVFKSFCGIPLGKADPEWERVGP